MAGIAGLLAWDGSAPDKALVKTMLECMAHRGPDGRAVASAGRVCLGLAAFRTQEDRPFDAAPLARDGVLVVADARLDERDVLAGQLGLEARQNSDAGLILAALRQDPAGAPARLLGDFAVALADERDGSLICLRDPFGVKPLYYARTPAGLAFASECKALLALPGVPHDLDEETLADFAAGHIADHHRTFHAAIRRLPGFHRLVARGNGEVVVEPYGTWTPASGLEAGQAPARLRALLHQAVGSRLGGARAPGLLLSGGLDSSSIAVLAAEIERGRGRTQPLRTFSAVFDATPEASEKPQIEAVLAQGGFAPEFLDRSGFDPLHSMPAILASQGQPVLAPGLGLMQSVYAAAAARGIRVMLDGHGGDEVVSHGFGRLGELARAGSWPALWQALAAVSRLYGEPRLPALLRYGLKFGPGPAWSLLRRAVRLKRRLVPAGATAARPASASPVSPRLRDATGVEARTAARRARDQDHLADEALAHRDVIGSGLQSYALEVLDRSGASVGIEPRFPFLDRRVVEFCLGLPAEAKLGQGYTRLVLRQAMEGLLPPSVQWRADKLDFGVHLAQGLARHRQAELDAAILSQESPVAAVFDMPALRAAYGRMRQRGSSVSGPDLHLVWRAAVLALWLGEDREADSGAPLVAAEAAP